LVRAAHDAGRAIVLDLVYNHLIGSPLQVLARDVYVSGETQWGDMVYFAHPAAREFFRQATVIFGIYSVSTAFGSTPPRPSLTEERSSAAPNM